ncbi:MAG: ABC transporter ATP-binding protein [Tepidisphaeraceae bacterium]
MKFLSRKKPPVQTSTTPIESNDEEQRYRPIEWWMVRRVLSGLRPYRRLYALGVLFAAIHVSLDMTGPQFIGSIYNLCSEFVTGAVQHGKGTLIERMVEHYTGPIDATTPASHGVKVLAIVVLAWSIVTAISIVLQRYTILFMTRAGESVQFDYRRRVFAHLQSLSMSYYDKTKLGRIISRMTSDIGGMREVNVWGVAHIIIQTGIILVSGYMLFQTDWRLFVSVAWLAPVLLVVNHRFIRRSGKQWQVVREGFTRVSTNLAENITGMRVVTAFNRQDPNLDTFNALQEQNTVNNVTAARINATFQPTLESIRFMGRIVILIVGAYLVASGRMHDAGVGGVVACYLYWDWFMNSIVFLGGFYNQLMQAMAGAERVFSLLEIKPDVVDVPDARPLPPIVGRVTFENVTFGYNPERRVLHDINFTAMPGQTVALVGATGSGKSSIISLIARFYQPQQGRVLVDGHDIRFSTGDSLHKQMGLVLQNNYLFTGSVLENIRYAKVDATKEQVENAAKALGTYDSIMSLKDGFDTDVGERGSNMSLGQRQLICFTRAFLADPRIFMLDEATSAVDTHTEQIIQDSLERLTKGRTTFIVAHRLSTIMQADQILVIDAGRIVERGTHDQLLAHGGKYAHLYEQFASGVAH